jgi:hypothetical protein
MARQASSKPADSTAHAVASFGIRHSGLVPANGSMSSNQSGETETWLPS